MTTRTAPATVAIYVRKFRTNRWPSYRVSERTERGGFRNAWDFSRYGDAMDFARAQARKQGVPVQEAEHQCA